MKANIKTAAVVVTYNRKELLVECVNGILNQSVPVECLYIVDNASTDCTFEFLCEKLQLSCLLKENKIEDEVELSFGNTVLIYKRLKKNVGGAGGFNEGINLAVKKNDYIWIMDDDTIPNINALEHLLLAAQNKKDAAFFASNVIDIEGNMTNVPDVDLRPYKKQGPQWNSCLSEGYIEISSATFVSLLFPKRVILRIGRPVKEFFIWYDDTEYTRRAVQNGKKAYLIGESIVLHKKSIAASFSLIDEESIGRIRFYKYFYRNKQYVIRKYESKKRMFMYFMEIISLTIKILRYSKKNKCLRIKCLLRGMIEGIFFNPQIEGVEIKNEI